MILHHIQTSPSRDSALKLCLRYACKEDAILLSSDGVNALLLRQWAMALSPFKLMVLKDDVIARGLSERLKNVMLIDYNEFVAQSLLHDKVITW
ncbi:MULTISPECIES: sulfurtransferase complex subunit TusB [Shewanella]|jgi:tRNA 2-thiouridine synthesizing protein B|uniref:Sulfurtransferase complex subunit TusB n=1 Tax=Shewanella oncorhynchi TaxID=2726434 RepID=A0ABX1KT62_9GAMM|nr:MULTISPECIES: sulfurtransferase complex subunit TusB [Shewanella]MBP6519443.1 sulfurtransferase complex subunit TusB [Shewanella sp.]MBS0043642.1 sulfurtransferase complex subunit TusB [Shewanella sp. M16]MCU7987357.1 sulfurtransferase complex subunit TusB [Shewanella sp. SW24]MCU8005429.1 sulfurtransferase complex subunit TusB [Shewanella sp. SM96]MCU8028733.1 sulfurtransferase complex subunit TusB [Shewanella sp. SM73]